MDNSFKYCAACLVTDVKMSPLAGKHTFDSSITLGDVFSRLLEIPIFGNCNICFECTRLLCKFEQFKLRCQRAQSLLTTVVHDPKVIKNINRKDHKLISNLTLSSVDIVDNLSDVELNSKTVFIKTELVDEIIKNEVTNDIDTNKEREEHKIFNEEFSESIDTYDGLDFVYSENSLHSDTIIITKENKKTKARKRKTKDNVQTVGIDNDIDDEPLSKISKRLNKNTDNVKKKFPKNFNINFFQDFATVVFLTPEDAKKELLLRKESTNYKTCPFKCEFCYKGFEAKTAYENHMKKHSVEYGEYECDFCHLRYPEQRFLCKHRLACHKRKFYCKLCSYVCYCTHQAKTHVSLHKGKKYPCPECDEVFSMPNSLLMHKRKKHVTECVCDLCGSTFATPRGLYSHNMKIHRQDVNNKEGPKCDECGIHFATEMAWKKHLVLSSKHNVSNGCKHCGERFTNREELQSHTRLQHARRQASRLFKLKFPMVCSICDKWLPDRNECKLHMTAEHPHSDVAKKMDLEDQTPFVCEICGQMYKKQCFLTYHQRKHTGERPYSCGTCGKTFAGGGALASHRAHVHERDRGHACRLCGRSFAARSGLNKHMKVHLGIRPHKCTICDKAFISPCDRKLHIKYVHNKVPWPKRDRTKRKNAEGTEKCT